MPAGRKPEGAHHGENKAQQPRGYALRDPRLADPEQLAHDQPKVEPGHVHQQPLQNVAVPSKVRPPHPARLVAVRETSLEHLSSTAQQPLSAFAADAPPIAIDRRLLGLLALPIATSTLRLRNVGPDAQLPSRGQHRIAVVSLVGDDLSKHL